MQTFELFELWEIREDQKRLVGLRRASAAGKNPNLDYKDEPYSNITHFISRRSVVIIKESRREITLLKRGERKPM